MRKGLWWVALSAVLCAACAKPADPVPAAKPATEPEPEPAISLLERAAGDHRIALIGELHGTVEMPRLVGEFAARRAGAGPVILALEIGHRQQRLISRYLASDGSDAARAALLAGEHWQDAMHDGRDSAAMLALIERMRALRAGGTPVAVLAFDPALPDMDARNRGMARILRKAASLDPAARIVVLTGNVHAMTRAQEMFVDGRRIVLETAGRALADLAPVSVDIRGAAGESWACMPGCAKRPVTSAPRVLAAPTLERNAPGSGWDYTLTLPHLVASPPAIEAVAPEATEG